jgi:hypothetical protein
MLNKTFCEGDPGNAIRWYHSNIIATEEPRFPGVLRCARARGYIGPWSLHNPVAQQRVKGYPEAKTACPAATGHGPTESDHGQCLPM